MEVFRIMIVPAVPTYLSNAFPPRSGLSGCGFGQTAPECDPTSDFYDEGACAEDYGSYGTTTTPVTGVSTSGGTIVPTSVTTPTTSPVTVNINNPSTTPVTAQPAPSSLQSFLQAIGIAATPALTKAAGTAITASSLPAGYSLINNPNGTQTIVSPQGVSTLVGATTASSLTTSLNSLLPYLLIGGAIYLVISMGKK
jgi:hypothetical protein